MKKSVLVSLLLGSISAMASAQTIYGVIDLSLAVESNGAGTIRKQESSVMNGSRLGFRGREDLGDGLFASYTMEMGINADDGSLGQGGLAFGRQIFVELGSTSAGSIRLGRQYSPVYFSQLNIDPFIGGTKGDMTSVRNWFNSGGVRVNNSVAYVAPNLSGLNMTAMYGFGEVAGNSSGSRVLAMSADYNSGPVAASFAYHNTRNAAGTDSQRVVFGGAAYDFGVVKLHGAVSTVKGLGTVDLRDSMIGVSKVIGNGRLIASYIQKQNRAIDSADAHQYALGYVYSLSKRTALYTSAARVSNEANSGINAGGVNGATDKVFDVGLRHSF